MRTTLLIQRNLGARIADAKMRPHLLWLILLLFLTTVSSRATTYTVEVAPGGAFVFSPVNLFIQPGDTVMWVWKASNHSVTSGTPDLQTSVFNSGINRNGFTFSYTFPNSGAFDYFCQPHGACCSMQGSVNVAAPTPAPQPLNISTRMRVQTGENIMIGGFIITGTEAKKVIVRAIGPSLAQAGLSDLLADPVLELRASNGSLIRANDNWKETQQTEIEASGVAPKNDLESAIVSTLNPGGYTAAVSGKGGTTGVGLVEVYDLNQAAAAKLANISTRGFVQTGSNVMIGGFILGGGTSTANIIVRGLGPSLTQSGVAGAITDPTLELRDSNGALVRSNDNWKESQQTEIQASTIPPTNDLESAIVATLPPAAYTAILAGKGGLTGVGLVEVYQLP